MTREQVIANTREWLAYCECIEYQDPGDALDVIYQLLAALEGKGDTS